MDMSQKGHIVSVNNTDTGGKNMFETLTQDLWIVTPAVWALLTTYLAWYFTRAKRWSPLTLTEARQLWIIHKRATRCNGKRWRQVKKQGQTVGFRCECGHMHLQEKPVVAHAPVVLENPQVSAFDKLHTSHKST
jgi:hypothetical protein